MHANGPKGPQQVPLAQSESFWHFLVLAHWGQTGPPQSTSVSPLFNCPSAQLTHRPALQRVLWQSSPVAQGLPSAQGGHWRSVPHPSVVFPQVVASQVLGVQQVSATHTSVAAQLPMQSSVPPQPSSNVGEQVVGAHTRAAVQQSSS
jgi:hypothetical protein